MSATLAGDTDDLEALFDSIVAANTDTPAPEPVAETAPAAATAEAAATEGVSCPGINEPFYSQIGHLTRKLHDTLHDLGLDKSLEKAVDNTIPDARDRLAYIATLTEKAAERVLNATDVAKPLQDQMDAGAANLSGQWDRLLKNELSIDDFKQLVTDTRGFLGTVTQHSKATNDQLLEIMMAQDFQDITGQVIKKIIEMAKEMENQLLLVLLQSSSPEKKAEMETGLLNGPVVNAEGRTDIVTSQEQVDDLLESLGF
ncbi:MAG: protein phosphatase CheZ [Hydrogenophilales bacterium]|nr:protein phosphatase CheZ [Hydrogenophilales bacterium]